MSSYKTVVLGATTNPQRYAYRAAHQLLSNGIEVVPIGIRKGKTAGDLTIINDRPLVEEVHTITLYINPQVQQDYYNYMLELNPKRIIFNPGTENPEFYRLLREQAPTVQIEAACTLVMLSIGNYKTANSDTSV
jgi:predicted CoA-binding protein